VDLSKCQLNLKSRNQDVGFKVLLKNQVGKYTKIGYLSLGIMKILGVYYYFLAHSICKTLLCIWLVFNSMQVTDKQVAATGFLWSCLKFAFLRYKVNLPLQPSVSKMLSDVHVFHIIIKPFSVHWISLQFAPLTWPRHRTGEVNRQGLRECLFLFICGISIGACLHDSLICNFLA
jgi:hypothetical protein